MDRVERVEPLAVAEEASGILREAWPPPVLHYTADYLRWQLGFPGPPARAVLARDGDEPAGFAALTPRRLRLGDVTLDCHLLSFVAVRPAFRRRGLASRLYDELLLSLREDGLAALVFTEAGSEAAQQPLRRAAARLELGLRPLSPHRMHGFVPRRGVAPGPLAAAPVSRERALEAIAACDAPGVIFGAPDLARLEHYDRDPRGRKLLAIEEEARITGLAMTFLSEVMTAQGLDRVATVDSVFLPAPTADRLSALVFGAAAAFAGEATSPAVSAPSLAALDAELVRAARLRATGTVYEAFVCHPAGHPFGGAEATNLEVV